MTEAVAAMLDNARSGRREVERQKHEDILLRFLPVLNEGFAIKKVPELVIGCYMLSVVLAQKAALEDKVLDGLMEAVVGSWTKETTNCGLICLSVLAQQKGELKLPKKVVKAIVRLDDAIDKCLEIAAQYPASQLLLGVISGCVDELEKQKDSARLNFVSRILEKGVLDATQTSKAIAMVLQAASAAHQRGEVALDVQTRLSELIHQVNESDSLRPLLQTAITESSIDVSSLEYSLQTVIEKEPERPEIEDVEMEHADEGENTDAFAKAMESLTGESLNGSSFLTDQLPAVFDRLVKAFALTTTSEERRDSFTNLPVLGKADAIKKPQFLSFFIRVFSGPYPISTRVAAINIVASCLSSNAGAGLDAQALLPYLLAALADPSERIRRETADLAAVVGRLYKKGKKNDSDTGNPWAHDTFYGQDKRSSKIQWLSGRDVQKVIERVLLPGLEEYVLDPSHVTRVFEAALRGSSLSENTADSSAAELKKSLRLSLFSFLCSHVVQTPLFAIKLRLLKLLNRIDRISGTTRTNQLQPLLDAWRTLSKKQVEEICEKEHISGPELEQEIVAIVSPKEKDAIDILVSQVNTGSQSPRLSFITAVFNRMKDIWAALGEERQLSASQTLLQGSLGTSNDDGSLENHFRDVLRGVELSGTILQHFINEIPATINNMESQAPAPKRRRTSQNNMVSMSVRDDAEMSQIMSKMTFVLELVDSSAPENHPQLAHGLFQTLAALHHFKSQVQSGMSYLLSLTLGSLLAIVNKSKTVRKPLFDTSVIRADLVVDCVRTTESPQVQNTALLLIAGLAVIAPELVLHSVMPIFTFMGSNVLRKDDEYSVTVIDQTIDQVVPILVQSLRNQKRDVVSGTSELLLSFTAAFEHIPSHRRLRLFQALITKLGTQDFLFAVLAMLANRYSLDKDVSSLMTGLVSNIGPELQLIVSFYRQLPLPCFL